MSVTHVVSLRLDLPMHSNGVAMAPEPPVHVVATIATGAGGAGGVLTGGLFFIPAFCWMIYAVMKSGAMSGKALAVSVSAGIVAHVLLRR